MTSRTRASSSLRFRLEAEQALDRRRNAGGDAPSLFAGGLVTVQKHPTSAENKEYLVVRASHQFGTQSYGSVGATAEPATAAVINSCRATGRSGAAVDAKAAHPWHPDRESGRQERRGERGDIDGRTRPHLGPVLLGSRAEEVLPDPGFPVHGPAKVGSPIHSADRDGGRRRIPGRRSRSAARDRMRV